MGLLEGKVALITGASRGIGRAIALRFASEGADIAFTYHSRHDAAESAVAEISALGVNVRAWASDASDFDASHEIVSKVIDEFGHVDILVCNAGVTRDGLMMRMTPFQWDEVMDSNLKSAFNFTHAVVPAMARQRSGSIIYLSSVVGLAGNPGQCNYAASKAGLVGLAKSVAKEMGPRGIRANCIAPGLILTDMTAAMPQKAREQALQAIPLRREGTAGEVADVALFLGCGMSSYVSGQVISCCGAMNC